jgi:IS1 family transposase
VNQLPLSKRTQIINLLVEGNSLRSTSRIADVSVNTVTKLLVEVGKACQTFHNESVLHLQSKRIQCDEIWSFVFAKEKNLPEAMRENAGAGDVWTWTALDAESRLMISWLVADRSHESAEIFLKDLAYRVANRIQLMSDGYSAYIDAVSNSFFSSVDYTQLSTSFIERQNLIMRIHMMRFTRLTSAFSKKIENHCYAIALHFVYYNFVKVHKSLRVTPAMEAGFAKRPMTIEDIVNMIE